MIFTQQDVARILAATQETMQSSQAATVINEDYQLGFRDALRAVAVAFGVIAPRPVAPLASSRRMQVLDGSTELAEVMDDVGRHEDRSVWPPQPEGYRRNGGRS
jgi:hypothetical protein